MDPLDAFYHTVRDYPGGAESLAPRMGMSANVLRNKADPRKDSNKAMLADADAAMGLTGDCRILHALAAKHGYVCFKLPDGLACDMAVLEMMTNVWSTNGELGQIVHRALSDGRLTAREMTRIEEGAYETIKAVIEAVESMKGMAEAE